MNTFIEIIKDKKKLHDIVSNDDTKAGKAFDICVMVAICISIILSLVETMPSIRSAFKDALTVIEYVLTCFFALEYIVRAYCEPRTKDYTLSFFGIVDFLATFPAIIAFIFPPIRYLIILRALRLFRVFRIFKLFAFINEGYLLLQSIKMSLKKILVYFLFVVVLVTILGTAMYMVEGGMPNTGFKDIPTSIYWAIVTLTTVGYGDITPATEMGKFLSSLIMILGYTIIAIPTGIVSATMIDETKKKGTNGRCPRCNQKTGLKANYCKHCGERL